jgi:hypothetical protein
MGVRDWLRLCRAQTWPADWLLVLVPFLTGSASLARALLLSVFMWFVHLVSFGENSLLDFTQGYDRADPSKQHHPLMTGAISVHDAVNAIHWGKGVLMLLGCLMALQWSQSPAMAMLSLFMWYAWGTAYNCGLSKESPLGFLPISICFTAMGGFGYYLSHLELSVKGRWYLAYVFTVILFQISWSGHLKEMGQAERSNLLILMGARLIGGLFEPGWAAIYGVAVKGAGIYVLSRLLLINYDLMRVCWFVAASALMGFMTALLVAPRDYRRDIELRRMSLMEIISIYGVIPLMLPCIWAVPLMILGVVYFVSVNRALWGVSHPRV